MKVEIWSDVMCPFCYIGKRRFEAALDKFPNKENIEVVWKSFQLNPDLKTDAAKSVNEYLVEAKGWSMDQARQANAQVTAMAKEVGLTYDLDRAVVANSFDAHRLIQFAKTQQMGDEMEERLFRAYFTEGKNIADASILRTLASDIGLDAERVKQVLSGDEYSEAVEADIYESQQIGVRGVPFFVLNDRYAVSGAQATETFAGALSTAWNEYAQQRVKMINSDDGSNASCEPGKDC